MGDLATEGWAGSPTGDRASHPVAGTESCARGWVTARAKCRQELCGPKSAIARGSERDKPRNPLHRGRRPVCNGGEGSSGRSPGREQTRAHPASRGTRRDGKRTEPARARHRPGHLRRGRRWQGNPKPDVGVAGVGSAHSIGEGGVMPVEGRGRRPAYRQAAHGGHAEAQSHVPVVPGNSTLLG